MTARGFTIDSAKNSAGWCALICASSGPALAVSLGTGNFSPFTSWHLKHSNFSKATRPRPASPVGSVNFHPGGVPWPLWPPSDGRGAGRVCAITAHALTSTSAAAITRRSAGPKIMRASLDRHGGRDIGAGRALLLPAQHRERLLSQEPERGEKADGDRHDD